MAVLNTGLATPATGDFTIPYSCRFNDGSTSHLKRTFGSAGDTQKWTVSFWVKRGQISEAYYIGGHGQQNIMSVGVDGNNYAEIAFASNDYLYFFEAISGAYPMRFYKDGYRLHDTGAWMHILIASDLSQGTDANQVRIYFNGVEWTDWNVSNTDNSTWAHWNSADEWNIGTNTGHNGSNFDGYLAEMHWIDGAQLTPASFGETGDYGEWKPIKVTGLTYGTNGFYLDFADSADLGNDVSGNNNDFTSVNLTAADQMLDSPTNNFATWNPLFHTAGNVVHSEGNLKAHEDSNGSYYGNIATMFPTSGKWYAEIIFTTLGTVQMGFVTAKTWIDGNRNMFSTSDNIYLQSAQTSWQNTTVSGGSNSVTAIATDAIIQLAWDVDNGRAWHGINGTWQNSGNPAAGTNYFNLDSGYADGTGIFTGLCGCGAGDTTATVFANFGQDSSFTGEKTAQGNQDGNGIGDFYYTPPSGFLALCTSNLPAATVTPSEHFNTILYTGDGNTDRGITGVGFQPDFVWIKQRATGAQDHSMYDSVRGANKKLKANTTDAEFTDTNALMSFDADGFEVDDDAQVNDNTDTYVAWNWKGGGSAASNGDGNVTTSVSANTDAGFSIVDWDGDGSGPNTYGHGLNLAPEFVTVKKRNDTSYWYTWFNGITSNYAVFLNDTNAQQNDGNITAVSATTITAADGTMCDSGTHWIAYCWHSVEGYSKIGLYEGNGSAHYGTYVYTGFRPKMIIVKNIDAGSNWSIVDVARDTTNVSQETKKLETDLDGAETNVAANTVDILSNGFSMRNTSTDMNASNTYVYLAFAETPFKYSNAR